MGLGLFDACDCCDEGLGWLLGDWPLGDRPLGPLLDWLLGDWLPEPLPDWSLVWLLLVGD